MKPAARFSHGCVEDASTGTMFIFGGVTEKYAELSDMWEYSLVLNRWRQLTYRSSLPGLDSRGGVFDHASVVLGNKLVVIGGLSYGKANQATLALDLYNISE